MSKSFAFIALLATLSLAGFAQTQTPGTVTRQNELTTTFTITAIDQATRSITLRAQDGAVDTYTVGPDVTRFNQLKVGDTIRATYHEAVVLQVRKPDAPAPTTGAQANAGRLGDRPGGVVGTQQTTTVTVKSVDMNAPSITVTTADGRTITRKVADKQNLVGVKAGDKIDVTYTQSLIVAAEPAQK